MKLIVYPYDFEYKVENNAVYVYSYCKLADGSKICIKHRHEVFFYASLDNVSLATLQEKLQHLEIKSFPRPAKILKTKEIQLELNGQLKPFLKIYANYPKAVPLLAKPIQEWGIKCFEKDILFIHRYLRDLALVPMTEMEAEGEYFSNNNLNSNSYDSNNSSNNNSYDSRNNSSNNTLSVPLFTAQKIEPKRLEASTSWRILAIDIETYSKNREIDFKQNPILMIALYGEDTISGQSIKKVITWKQFPTEDKTIHFVNNEKELLKLTAKEIKAYSPEIMVGYFSDVFDLPYIKIRCEINKIVFPIGLDNTSPLVRKPAGSKSAEVKITGIIHIDMLKFIKQIFGLDLKVESYNLDTIAEKLLGHKKKIVNLDQLAEAWDNSSSSLESFCQYNLQDSKLTFLLGKKLLSDMIEFSTITGLPLFDVTRMRFGRLVESYILKKAISRRVIAPNRPADAEIEERMSESIQGAFVYEPKPGLYSNLVVFDFRSLYPSIIVSHNIGPEGLYCNCCQNYKVPGTEYWFCQEKKSFLPSLLKEIIDRRAEVKSLIKNLVGSEKTVEKAVLEAKSYALKILANSFYGYLAFYGARWYSRESAAATTAYARFYIKDTIQKAIDRDFTICYADTDSCFLQLGNKTTNDALKFRKEINQSLPGNMELNYEGYFPKGIFVGIKGLKRSKGAKKKYALLKEDGSIKITGFETVRRNWSWLAKEVQKDILRLVLQDRPEKSLEYIQSIIKDLRKGKVPVEKLVLKTQITRDLSQYKSIGPHIYIARKLLAKGQSIGPGTLIKYVIVRGSGLVRERAKIPSEVKEGDYDYNYYIHHQLIPAVSSILAVFNYSEQDIFKEGTQRGLGSFI